MSGQLTRQPFWTEKKENTPVTPVSRISTMVVTSGSVSKSGTSTDSTEKKLNKRRTAFMGLLFVHSTLGSNRKLTGFFPVVLTDSIKEVFMSVSIVMS